MIIKTPLIAEYQMLLHCDNSR